MTYYMHLALKRVITTHFITMRMCNTYRFTGDIIIVLINTKLSFTDNVCHGVLYWANFWVGLCRKVSLFVQNSGEG